VCIKYCVYSIISNDIIILFYSILLCVCDNVYYCVIIHIDYYWLKWLMLILFDIYCLCYSMEVLSDHSPLICRYYSILYSYWFPSLLHSLFCVVMIFLYCVWCVIQRRLMTSIRLLLCYCCDYWWKYWWLHCQYIPLLIFYSLLLLYLILFWYWYYWW